MAIVAAIPTSIVQNVTDSFMLSLVSTGATPLSVGGGVDFTGAPVVGGAVGGGGATGVPVVGGGVGGFGVGDPVVGGAVGGGSSDGNAVGSIVGAPASSGEAVGRFVGRSVGGAGVATTDAATADVFRWSVSMKD